MKVITLSKKLCDQFVVAKHYTHRACVYWAGFGLVVDDKIQGVCVYGQPSPPISRSAFKDRDFRLFELSRLVVQTAMPNAASFLIGNSLSMLEPKPCAVVSYADSGVGHCGIVYQATNWKYTGSTLSHDVTYIVDGKPTHSLALTRGLGISNPKKWARENNIPMIKPAPKHRYFTFVGNKKQKAAMQAKLSYIILDKYPKVDKTTYDAGPTLDVMAP